MEGWRDGGQHCFSTPQMGELQPHHCSVPPVPNTQKYVANISKTLFCSFPIKTAHLDHGAFQIICSHSSTTAEGSQQASHPDPEVPLLVPPCSRGAGAALPLSQGAKRERTAEMGPFDLGKPLPSREPPAQRQGTRGRAASLSGAFCTQTTWKFRGIWSPPLPGELLNPSGLAGALWCPKLAVPCPQGLCHPSDDVLKGFSGSTHGRCRHSRDTCRLATLGTVALQSPSIQPRGSRNSHCSISAMPEGRNSSPRRTVQPTAPQERLGDGWSEMERWGRQTHTAPDSSKLPPTGTQWVTESYPAGGLAAPSPASLKSKSSSEHPASPPVLPHLCQPETTGGADDVTASSLQLLSQRLMWIFPKHKSHWGAGNSLGRASRGLGGIQGPG